MNVIKAHDQGCAMVGVETLKEARRALIGLELVPLTTLAKSVLRTWLRTALLSSGVCIELLTSG